MTRTDDSVFPDPVYKDTVLAPLFDITKRQFAEGLAAINQAHAIMLAETGILDEASAAAILQTLDAIASETDLEALTYTGEVEDLFFHIETELKRRLGPELGGRLHTGRSRNDMDHTLFKLRLAEHLDGLRGRLIDTIDRLLDKAEAEAGTIIVAFTHGQPAQPTTLGHFLGAVIEMLLRDGDRLAQARDGLDDCPMGAAAITTTGFPIDRPRMAELLGFARVKENAYGCIAAVDYVLAVYSAIKVLFVNLGRVTQELAHWTAFETAQLYVPNAYVQISSIMPQKRNPVPVEHMRLLASLTVGRCDMIVDTMRNTPFMDMNDSEGEVQNAGYDAFASGDRMLRLFGGFVDAVEADDAAVNRLIDASCITITELADSLVRHEGLSFREAHEVAAAVSQAVIAQGGGLSGLGFEAFKGFFQDATGRQTQLTARDFARFISPEHFVGVRERPGGPGPKALATSLAGYRQSLDQQAAALTADRERRQAANSLRRRLADDLIAKQPADRRAAAGG